MIRETGSPARTTAPWATLTPDQHEYQYNPQKAFPGFARYGKERAGQNEQVRRDLKPVEVRYGEHALRTLDVYRAPGTANPVHIFLHGGYWRTQDKQNFAFIAGALVPVGITTVIVNYELCPQSTLDGVVDSALSAFEWTCRNIANHGGDPRRISLSGHSAGAHLAAEILATDWSARGVDASAITGTTLISGIFDPTPAMKTTVNEQLRLTPELASRHDVERRPLKVQCPVAIIAGSLEPEQWVDQSLRYYHHLRRHGMCPELHVLEGHDHFGILTDYLEAHSPTLRAITSHTLQPQD
ncbi:alpha/beta hydrolase [Ramlibacter ginsenosidimutans]|uniref:Alpha/beta hydrolase n=1 Tax=Ramlibacter ginsenosidimutans TaxID=502333 RepID=A0A934TWF5_9BURK|nr:alpha/beta hydrolase [Ramlibacter ginsenosidimutans]MBK6008738.1 alpha/beta hydrolase [Ramlibacter ginsenosidimutans]